MDLDLEVNPDQEISAQPDPAFCYIHIGKTGGTALKAIIAQHSARHNDATVQSSGHIQNIATLAKKFPETKFAFFVREPSQRFVSGFNSRLRRGQPRYDVPWSLGEEAAFGHFQTPNSLAESLYSADDAKRDAAEKAMHCIVHARKGLQFYLVSRKVLKALQDRIAFIGDHASFDEDVVRLRNVLGIDPTISLPSDDVGAHRTPDTMERKLSHLAMKNLRKWYFRDYRIYAWCLELRQALIAGG